MAVQAIIHGVWKLLAIAAGGCGTVMPALGRGRPDALGGTRVRSVKSTECAKTTGRWHMHGWCIARLVHRHGRVFIDTDEFIDVYPDLADDKADLA